MSYIKLSSNYGYSSYSVSDLEASSVIDASGASWTLSNSRNSSPDSDTSWSEGTGQLNTYPFKVNGAGAGLQIIGGSIWGQVPQQSDWLYTYNNSAALRIESAPGVKIDDWRIDGVWDGIRIASGTTNFLIDDVYLSHVRDDAVENDYVLSGTIRDSLFDGVFSGISLGSGSYHDGSANTVTIESTFIHNQSYLYKGEVTHVSPIKANTGAPETTPDIRIINSVFAIEDPDHESQSRLQLAWDNVVESRGNVFLNLSDTPLPSDYPMPPAGFTILQGQEARDYWEACKAAWLANHDGTGDTELTALPPLPGADPAPEPAPAPAPTPVPVAPITDGPETFIFDKALSASNIQTIADFDPSEDRIYLDNAIFAKLGSGSLDAPKQVYDRWFEEDTGGIADDRNDYVLYDTNTGKLYYDADGSRSGDPVHFATLSPGLALSHTDFYVI